LSAMLLLGAVGADAQKGNNQASTTSVFSEDGKLQMLIDYDPGCSCRTYTEFYHNGKILSRRRFKVAGKKEYIDGEDVSFFQDGSIKSFKMWQESFPVGKAFSNYENGKLEHEEYYEDRYKSGTWRYYDRTGALVREVTYEKGRTPWNGKLDIGTEKKYTGGKLTYTGEIGKFRKSFKDQKPPPLSAGTSAAADGKSLFAANCASCHAPHSDGAGPALAGVTQRRKKEWLEQMIRDGNVLVDMEDRQAQDLFRKWKGVRHPVFKKLTGREIEALIGYLDQMGTVKTIRSK